MGGSHNGGISSPSGACNIVILHDEHAFQGKVHVTLVVDFNELIRTIQFIENDIAIVGTRWRLGGVATFETEKSNCTVNIDSTRSGIGIVPFAIGIAAVGSRSRNVGRVIGIDTGQVEIIDGNASGREELNADILLGRETAVHQHRFSPCCRPASFGHHPSRCKRHSS